MLQATSYVFTDMQSDERHGHAGQCYNITYKRAAALLQWFDQVSSAARGQRSGAAVRVQGPGVRDQSQGLETEMGCMPQAAPIFFWGGEGEFSITETGHRRQENTSTSSYESSELKSDISRLRHKSILTNIVIIWSGERVGKLLGKFQ